MKHWTPTQNHNKQHTNIYALKPPFIHFCSQLFPVPVTHRPDFAAEARSSPSAASGRPLRRKRAALKGRAQWRPMAGCRWTCKVVPQCEFTRSVGASTITHVWVDEWWNIELVIGIINDIIQISWSYSLVNDNDQMLILYGNDIQIVMITILIHYQIANANFTKWSY